MTTKAQSFADFHTHILPFVDDGAQSVEIAASMLCQERKLADEMYGKSAPCYVVFTPHFKSYNMTVEEFLARRDEGVKALFAYLRDSAPPEKQELASRINWAMGAEIMVHSDLDKVENLDKLFMGNSNYLMFEFSGEFYASYYVQTVERICFKYNARPIIAHFERYMEFVKEEDYRSMARLKNVIFQFNASAICPRKNKLFFRNIKTSEGKHVLQYFRTGVPSIMGSDCHSNRQRRPDCLAGYESFRRFATAEEYEALLQFKDEMIAAIFGDG